MSPHEGEGRKWDPVEGSGPSKGLNHPRVQRALDRGRPLRVVLSWDKMARPLCALIDQSLGVGCPGKGGTKGRQLSFRWADHSGLRSQ